MAYPVIATDDDRALFERRNITDPKLRKRITMERMIVRKAARDLIAAGFWLRLHNGEDWAHRSHQDVALLMSDLQATDEETLSVRVKNPHVEGKFARIGSISLVYGNDGWDVIADNTVNLEPYLKGASELADKLAA